MERGTALDIRHYILDVSYFTGIEEINAARPGVLALTTYPNPFNSAVKISVEQTFLSVQNGQTGMSDLPLKIEIFDIAGRRVAELSPRHTADPLAKGVSGGGLAPLNKGGCPEGTGGILTWQPSATLSSGIYLVRATMGDESLSKRVVYLK